MTATDPRHRATEAEFQAAVTQLAQACGWRVMHVRRSRVRQDRWATATSIPGWPDLTLLGHSQVIYVELKTTKGRLSAAQVEVLDELRNAGQDVRVWRPTDWREIDRTLTGGRAR